MLLTGDIGGTKTVLALFKEGGGAEFEHQPLREAVFPSGDFDSLETIIETFLADFVGTLSGASFGIAGPVVENRVEVTNLPWVIDAKAITTRFGVETKLLNDLEAIANAVPHLQADDVMVLHPGDPEPHGAIAVIAPGTGLGEAFLVWTGDRYEAYPSEGGHAAFAPITPQQSNLLAYWQKRLDHVSYERLCSGMGIPNIYQYLRESEAFDEPEWLREQLAKAADPTPIIVQTAVSTSHDIAICARTLDLFMEILGTEAANLALKVLATGGVYIGGGIPPRILPQLQASRFMALFQRKGRFSDLMARMPVHVIRNPNAALLGTAYEALRTSTQP
ncbi:MAG: glucokinase [Anaerolineales bacterium]|nr:glucokinase [Anaerolineales bacterium]